MMRSFFKRCGVFTLGAACAAGAAQAQDYRAPSMLSNGYRSVVAPTSAEPTSPSDIAPGAIHGGYGYYGDQAPGVVYEGAHGADYAGVPTPEPHGSIACEGADCASHGGFRGRLAALGCRQSCWFGGVRGLIMDLDDGDDVGYSFDDGVGFEPQLLRTDENDMEWSGGVEARVGRWFNCCQNGIELVYWGLYPSDVQAGLNAGQMVGNLGHTFTFNALSYDDGLGGGVQAVDTWYQPAQAHRLRRDWEFHNVELNLLTVRNAYVAGNCAGCGPALGGLGCWDACQPRLNLTWIAGFRFFRFDEGLEFASDIGDGAFTGGLDEMYYLADVKNEMYGFQLGADAEYFLTRRISVNGVSKFGVFNNEMRQRTYVGGANGFAFVNDPLSPNFGRQYNITSEDDEIALLGELDLGGNFYLTNNLRLTGGYRLVAASGVARAVEQQPANFDDILGATEINNHGMMFLHGAYAGVEFNY